MKETNVSLEEQIASNLMGRLKEFLTLMQQLRQFQMTSTIAKLGRLEMPVNGPEPKKRHLSAAARERIAAAQRARWKKVNEEKEREAKRVKGSAKYEAQRAAVAARKRKG